jgi:hydrogenase maturation protein HypF
MELEALAETSGNSLTLPYAVTLDNEGLHQADFAAMIPTILHDLKTGVSTAATARRFHASVAQASTEICTRIAGDSGLDRVVLSGGVFQNRLLTEMIYTGLTEQGLQVFTHRLSPPNDGCIALGQAAIAGWKTRRTT